MRFGSRYDVMVLKLRKKVPPPPGCPMSACMNLLGGAWTPDVIWNLSEGARRFSELRRAMPVISAKVLSARLKDLEERGVVSRSVLATTPPSVDYALTDLGEELIPAIRAIVEVGSKLHQRTRLEAAGRAA
ncbi:DNA-binding HxlR family transcriptional regulator [Methylobacterium brachythecii]|uniref:DNA-binding HxlR family transcriptional regulator n=3 Tax=Methylobacterium brachythecii TaxID=1176177 RepID=A0A7W6AL34_9HYPH|nr:helix-turn-helix domain-containing protein [Methylobacterium brachythecii]MBB3905438.1 DNA-binding HxlR family transcriptional regulator [Methylobacterium brachythecii]